MEVLLGSHKEDTDRLVLTTSKTTNHQKFNGEEKTVQNIPPRVEHVSNTGNTVTWWKRCLNLIGSDYGAT